MADDTYAAAWRAYRLRSRLAITCWIGGGLFVTGAAPLAAAHRYLPLAFPLVMMIPVTADAMLRIFKCLRCGKRFFGFWDVLLADCCAHCGLAKCADEPQPLTESAPADDGGLLVVSGREWTAWSAWTGW